MKSSRSLDTCLLALITVAFGVLCASALLLDIGWVPAAYGVTSPA